MDDSIPRSQLVSTKHLKLLIRRRCPMSIMPAMRSVHASSSFREIWRNWRRSYWLKYEEMRQLPIPTCDFLVSSTNGLGKQLKTLTSSWSDRIWAWTTATPPLHAGVQSTCNAVLVAGPFVTNTRVEVITSIIPWPAWSPHSFLRSEAMTLNMKLHDKHTVSISWIFFAGVLIINAMFNIFMKQNKYTNT